MVKLQSFIVACLFFAAIESGYVVDSNAEAAVDVTFKYEYWSVQPSEPVREANVLMGKQCPENGPVFHGFNDAYTCNSNGDLQFRNCGGDCKKPLKDCLVYNTIPASQNGKQSTGKLISRYTWSCPASVTVADSNNKPGAMLSGEYISESFSVFSKDVLPMSVTHKIIANPTENGLVPERCASGAITICNKQGGLIHLMCEGDCTRPISEGCKLVDESDPVYDNGPLQMIPRATERVRQIWTCPNPVVETGDDVTRYNLTKTYQTLPKVKTLPMGMPCQEDALIHNYDGDNNFGYYCSATNDLNIYYKVGMYNTPGDCKNIESLRNVSASLNNVSQKFGLRYKWSCNPSLVYGNPKNHNGKPEKPGFVTITSPVYPAVETVTLGDPCPLHSRYKSHDGYAYTCNAKGDLEKRYCGLFACTKRMEDCKLESTTLVSENGVAKPNTSFWPNGEKGTETLTWRCPPSINRRK